MTNGQVEIVEAIHVRGHALVSCDIVGLDFDVGAKLTDMTAGTVWEVIALAHVAHDLFAKGRRGATLSPSLPGAMLKPGDVLLVYKESSG